VVAADYVPARGDIVWLNFDPQAGHEQAGHRPALVLSPERYNRLRGMIICCPLTTRIKGYPFEVAVAGDPPSVILADQIKSLNWRARRAVRKDRATPQVLAEVDAKIRALLLL
jgi:mRNA interferase MazF